MSIDERDRDLLDQAIGLVVSSQTASYSLLQRQLRIGYPQARRLIDYMEQQGIVIRSEGRYHVVRRALEGVKQR